MTTWLPFSNIFLIAGMIFLLISILGQSKLGFAEINPGLFGRIVALVIGILCLIIAVFLVIFPSEFLREVIRNVLAERMQQNKN